MRYFLFDIGRRFNLRAEWISFGLFKKKRHFFFFVDTEKNHTAKKQFFWFMMLGLVLRFSRPYAKKFSYGNMPEIKGRTKVK